MKVIRAGGYNPNRVTLSRRDRPELSEERGESRMKTAEYGGRDENAMKGRDWKKLWVMLCAVLLLLCLSLLSAGLAGTKASAESVVVIVPVDPDHPDPGNDPDPVDDPAAYTVKNESNTSLSTLGIPNPAREQWYMTDQFSYVYYGRYGGTPTRYRVLDRNSWNFGVSGGSLLLDCDSGLFIYRFDLDNVPNEGTDRTNDWAHSDVRAFLNGSFLHSDKVFTAGERSAIAASHKTAAASGDGCGADNLQFTPLNGEKIFLLDHTEASRVSYGFGDEWEGDSISAAAGRVKDGKKWLLRSPYYHEGKYYYEHRDHPEDDPHALYDSNGHLVYHTGMVNDTGEIGATHSFDDCYVSPALNVARSRILFSTLTSPENREYKLTLLDDSLSVSMPEGQETSQQGNTLTVPYVTAGSPNKLSVLVTDREYNDPSASIRVYRSADCSGGSGTVSITLPFAYTDAVHMYLIAERIRGDQYTDCASIPLEIRMPEKSLVSFDANGGEVSPAQAETGPDGRLDSLPEPVREGMFFDGWYTDPQAGESVTTDTVFTADCTVYAHWIPVYTITFVDDSHGTSFELQTDRNGQLAGRIPGLEDEESISFDGWYTDPEGGEKITDNTIFSADSTVYARWISGCVVLLDANGGEMPYSFVNVREDGLVVINDKPTRAGYFFDDWYTAPEGGESAPSYVYSNCTFYAHWRTVQIVTFDANGGTVTVPQIKVNSLCTLKASDVPTANRPGYLFNGWFTAPEGGNSINSYTEFLQDTTVYAHWVEERNCSYKDRDGRQQTVSQVKLVNGFMESYSTGWYVVNRSIKTKGRIVVSGDVNLILCDGGKLTAKSGIQVQEGSTLSIWGQTAGSGELIASGVSGKAGIGGNKEENCGKIMIYGGNITVQGSSGSAGIGSGKGASGGQISIYGGTVTATSKGDGAGIGGGYGGAGGQISIYGGTVNASASKKGAGIGGGEKGAGGQISIHGGTVTATSKRNGAGIGGGYTGAGGEISIHGGTVTATSKRSGAGIGGGEKGAGGEISIHGGTVNASTSKNGAGIGGGGKGAGGQISIYGGTVNASASKYSAGIGSGRGSDEHKGGGGGTIIIRGGQVYASSIGPKYDPPKKRYGAWGTVELSWSGTNDFISTGSIIGSEIKLDRPFCYTTAEGSYNGPVTVDNLSSKDPDDLIRPDLGSLEISLSEENLLMYAGEERTLRGEVQDDAEGTWEWTVDNPQTATVTGDSESITVTALNPGSAVITAYYSSGENHGGRSAEVTVVPVPVLITAVEHGSVTAEPANPVPGDTVTLTFLPDGEYTHLGSTVVTCNGEAVETTQTGQYTRTFTMPYGDVNVSAAFCEGGRFVVGFVNIDGQMLHWDYYTEGTLPTYDGTPAFGPTNQYSFTFTGWDREIEPVTEDTLYYATYDAALRSWPVSFTNWNGDVLWSGNVTWGETPAYEGDEPARPSDAEANYTFRGWTPEIGPVTGETVYEADYKAAPILRQGPNTVTLEMDETVSCTFTPPEDGYYRFHTDADSAFCYLYVLDGNERIAEGVNYTAEEWDYIIDCAVELEGNHPYTLELLTYDFDTELTLYAEPTDVYFITVIPSAEHGAISECPKQAYAGQMLAVATDPEEGYWLKELVVTDANGNEIKTDMDRFIMPGANVTVSAVFGKLMPITVNAESPFRLAAVAFNGLMGDPEAPASVEGAQVEMVFSRMEEIEEEGGTEEEEAEWQDEIGAIIITGADGTEVECEISEDEEGNLTSCQFIMPGGPVTVQVSRYEEIPPFGTADFRLPADTRTVEESAFEMNVFMTSAEIPAGCKSIGRWAFRGCVNLARIRIPADCTVGADAFEGCYKVYVYGTPGSPADIYCRMHSNCQFVEE